MSTNDEDAPKIIIDEGWKSQVERERETAREHEAEPEDPDQDLKEANLTLFDYLVSTLAAQTMMALGLMPEEDQQQVMVDLGAARHLIDSLVMLREKTQGNLSEDETKNLDEAVSELQRVFTVRAQQVQEAKVHQPTIDPNPPELTS